MITAHDFGKFMRKGYARTAEPSVACPSHFRHFIAIPVMDELNELPNTLSSLSVTLAACDENIGVMLVVNNAPDCPQSRREANLQTLSMLRSGELSGGLRAGENLFWIDAASDGRELRRGVGEARRIALDSAAALLDPSRLEEALLFCLDADSPVAPDYCREVLSYFAVNRELGAASLAVRHRTGADAATEAAIRRYEKYMLDYVENLRQAGSPYAFHTIGSAVVCRLSAYLACGGMRVRSGGEDFYFMQALKKVAPMGEFTTPLVFPAARPSDRVPFGTGPAIRSLLEGNELPQYAPEAFAELGVLLRAVSDDNLRELEKFDGELNENIRHFLTGQNFYAVWPDVVRNTPQRSGQLCAAFHRWFDGLKTLQFIHCFSPR